MADGRIHDRAGWITTALSVAIAHHYSFPSQVIVFGGTQIFTFLLASPDVDTWSNPVKRWGPLHWIWKPLQDRTRHRGITHNPVFGPIVVFGYLAIAVFVVAIGFGIAVVVITGNPQLIPIPRPQNAWNPVTRAAIAGVYFQYWVHLFLDWLFSAVKRVRSAQRE